MPLLPDILIKEKLSTLDGDWTRIGSAIEKTFSLKTFDDAIALINHVATVANALDHHPDIHLFGWNKVRFCLSSHDKGGITERDFKLAAEIERTAKKLQHH